MTRAAVFVGLAALAVFCGVQDRVTAAGARQYADRSRAALAGRGPAVTIDEIMRPAVRRSVGQALLWGGAAAGVGFAGVVVPAWRRRRA